MKISILIVTRKWNPEIHFFDYIDGIKQSNIDFEVLIAEGNNPSSQRNTLAKAAEGEFMLFLDDDSVPESDLLEKYYQAIKHYPEIEILGGPSLLAKNKKSLNSLSHVFFSSFFGIGPIRNRYNSIGSIRKATEKDLILCNLLVRRDFFLKTAGFDQVLYPGEENAFIKSLHRGTQIFYDPEAIVYREPRESLHLFLLQMFSYGKGRAKHLRLNYFFEFLFLIPLIFAAYLLLLPSLLMKSLAFVSPLILHLGLSLVTLLENKKWRLNFLQMLLLPIFILLGHFGYGLGLMVGLLKYKVFKKIFKEERAPGFIRIHKLKNFKKSSP